MATSIYTQKERTAFVKEYNNGQLNQKAFCEAKGISYGAFVGWLARAKREKKTKKTSAKRKEAAMKATATRKERRRKLNAEFPENRPDVKPYFGDFRPRIHAKDSCAECKRLRAVLRKIGALSVKYALTDPTETE